MESPILLDNVTVSAGAKIIGGVMIGNSSIVGANTIVVKNVPDCCTVVGVQKYIRRNNGKKVKIKL